MNKVPCCYGYKLYYWIEFEFIIVYTSCDTLLSTLSILTGAFLDSALHRRMDWQEIPVEYTDTGIWLTTCFQIAESHRTRNEISEFVV